MVEIGDAPFVLQLGTLELPVIFSRIRDLTLWVRHRVEEVEAEQVTFPVASKVTFPLGETRRERSYRPFTTTCFIMPSTARDKLAKTRASVAREKTPPSPENSDDG